MAIIHSKARRDLIEASRRLFQLLGLVQSKVCCIAIKHFNPEKVHYTAWGYKKPLGEGRKARLNPSFNIVIH